jgi:hypothetical protein
MLADLSGGHKARTEQARRSDLVEWSALCSLCGVPLFTQRLARNLAPSGLAEAPGDDSGRAGPLVPGDDGRLGLDPSHPATDNSTQAWESSSACSSTVSVAFSCLSGG